MARWRTYALVGLLVTQAYQVAPEVVGEGHSYLIAPEKRVFALSLLERWLDSLSLSKGLDDAILEADRIAALGNDMGKATIKHGPFLSHAAERAIFAIRARTWHNRAGENYSRHSLRSKMMYNVTHKGSGTTRIATLTSSPFLGES